MRTLWLVLVLAGICAAPAAADGLPVLGIDVGAKGVVAPGGAHRHVAIAVGNDTLVATIQQRTGRVMRSRILRGPLTIPAVAYDGSAEGLSVDGATLALIVPRTTFPRATTGFAIVDTRNLRVVKRLVLRGDYSFDARSPDGRWLYLIRYTSADDPLRYEVRVLELATGRLARRPIVDPREPDETMAGRPLTRTTSTDGRWAYTLYDGPAHPFVHALDTAGRSARCIDLDWLYGRKDLARMRLAILGKGVLEVRSGRRTAAVIDRRTFAVRRPVAASARGGMETSTTRPAR